jgi:GGDEF domain-containing protein
VAVFVAGLAVLGLKAASRCGRSPDRATTSGDATLTPNELIRQADEKLFQAKQDGRNRVVA